MNENLELRYWNVLNTYEVKSRVVERIKQELLDHTFAYSVQKSPSGAKAPRLRPDAALCLLTLYDSMIIRPYAAKAPSAGYPLNFPPPSYEEDSPNFQRKVDLSLQSIFDTLLERDTTEPHSSHEVLRAINSAWEIQSQLFGWG